MMTAIFNFIKGLFKKRNWVHEIPQEGKRIEITWLPFNNAYPEPNCYIGSKGIVEDVQEDGSFVLRFNSGSSLIVGTKYKFKYLDTTF